MRYGELENAYAEPVAMALLSSQPFRSWVLSQSIFQQSASSAWVLAEEMQARRGKSAHSWWRSHFTEKCRCKGCSGQEADILSVFENEAGERFAIHFEVKQPKDRFLSGKDQAANYSLRAACWSKSPPRAVIPHSAATTCLVYSASKELEYAPQLPEFAFSLTFENIRHRFPSIAIPEHP